MGLEQMGPKIVIMGADDHFDSVKSTSKSGRLSEDVL